MLCFSSSSRVARVYVQPLLEAVASTAAAAVGGGTTAGASRTHAATRSYAVIAAEGVSLTAGHYSMPADSCFRVVHSSRRRRGAAPARVAGVLLLLTSACKRMP